MDRESEVKLIEMSRDGDRRCFDLLVHEHRGRLLGMLRRILKNDEDALDVSQDALLRAWQALPSFRGDSAFYTWLYRIAINTARNFIGHRTQQMARASSSIYSGSGELEKVFSTLTDGNTPEQLLLRDEVLDTIQNACDALPDELRTAILLREVDGLSYIEIATAMDCPIGTVRSRIFRARDNISDALRRLNADV